MSMRAAGGLMIATMLTTSIVSGTYANYVTSDSATDTARVAKFGVEVKAEGALFGKNYLAADDTKGQLQDGRTKTFSAKALPELWDEYNTNYFSELASHAIMFSEDIHETDPSVTVTKVNMDGSPYSCKWHCRYKH